MSTVIELSNMVAIECIRVICMQSKSRVLQCFLLSRIYIGCLLTARSLVRAQVGEPSILVTQLFGAFQRDL